MNYKYCDKIIKYLILNAQKQFKKYYDIADFDELNIIRKSKDLYAELYKTFKQAMYKLADYVYRENVENDKKTVNKKWIDDLFKDYDDVLLIVLDNETERKRTRFVEGVISSADKPNEIKKAMNYWCREIKSTAIVVNDRATLQAYKDDGVEYIIWHTAHDEKVCGDCNLRDGVKYPIDEIPTKHPNCRCWYEKVVEKQIFIN